MTAPYRDPIDVAMDRGSGLTTYIVTGDCFLAGTHHTARRINREVQAPTAEQAAEQAKLKWHRDIWVRATPNAQIFVLMFGSRACGQLHVKEKP